MVFFFLLYLVLFKFILYFNCFELDDKRIKTNNFDYGFFFNYPRSEITHRFPFIVFFTNEHEVICLGSLFDYEYVLTSYQCVVHLEAKRAFTVHTVGKEENFSAINSWTPGNYARHPDFQYLYATDPLHTQSTFIENITLAYSVKEKNYVYPGYTWADFDLAVIKLDEPVRTYSKFLVFLNFYDIERSNLHFIFRYRGETVFFERNPPDWMELMLEHGDVSQVFLFIKPIQRRDTNRSMYSRDCLHILNVSRTLDSSNIWCFISTDETEDYRSGLINHVYGGCLLNFNDEIVAIHSLTDYFHGSNIVVNMLQDQNNFVNDALDRNVTYFLNKFLGQYSVRSSLSDPENRYQQIYENRKEILERSDYDDHENSNNCSKSLSKLSPIKYLIISIVYWWT